MSAASGPRPRERGSATVIVIAIVGALVLAGAAATAVGLAMEDRAHARTAADLAALAGARAARAAAASDAPDHGCDVAAIAARVNRARLTSCVRRGIAEIHVEVRVGRALAEAAAGPRAHKRPGDGSG